MLLIDCPHCYTRVVPRPDGTCPACQKDTRDTTGLDTTRTSIRVSQGDVLPSICCECGQPTTRVISVCRQTRREGEPSTGAAVVVFWLFSWLVGLWLMLRGAASTTVVEVQMPQCEACAGRGPPEPRYVDFDNARMTFIVHRNLKQASTT